MKDDMSIKLQRAVLPFALDGRKTVPAVGMDDKAFVYTKAINTNLAERFRTVLAGIGERRTVKA